MPQLKPTRGIRLNKSHPLARGLVGCWLFNEGSGNKVFDLSGNGNTGTFQSTTSWSSGKFGPAIVLNGSSDYIQISDSSIFDFPDEFSISVWVNASVLNADKSVLMRYNTSSKNGYGLFIQDSPNVWEFAVYVGGSADIARSDSAPTSGWHHLVGVRTVTGSLILYLDGIRQATTGSMSGAIDAASDLLIGRRSHQADRYFSGLVDVPAIFNRALSVSEITQLYREPFCMFERAWIPKLIGGQIVELAGSSVALSSLSATAKAMRKVGGNVVSTTDVTAILKLIRSLLYIESNWKREALFNGMTANAFKLGTTLSLGWFWVRVAGCSVLYRGSSMGEIDFVNILAVSEQDAREISPPSYISHNSGSTYFYVVRRFNNCGYQERTLAASVKVSIESNGELAEPQPNKVFDSGAELVDGNKILLVWYYCPLEQKSQPMCFNVYYDGRTGQINYENPLAIIGYKGRKFYRYQCGALEAGRYLFAIRTEDASGIENSSLARLRIQFDPTNPAAIDILSVEGV